MPNQPTKRERPVDPKLRVVGGRIKALMAEHPTINQQKKLGEMTGIGKTSMSHILSGRQAPSVQQLQAIAKALGVSVASLMPPDRTEPPTPQQPTSEIDPDQLQRVFIDYVAKHKDNLTENEIRGILDGSYQLDGVIPDEQAITDFLRAKRALLERLNSSPRGS
mgnify:CR=1 FL=1